MKTVIVDSKEILVMLSSLAGMKGPQPATFANKKWKGEVDLRDKEQAEIKKLIGKSLSIECPEGKFTRPSITSTWEFKAVDKLRKKIKKAEAELEIPDDFMEDSLEDEMDKILDDFVEDTRKGMRKAKARRAGRKGRRAGSGGEAAKPVKTKARRAKAEGQGAQSREGSQGAFITECLVAGMSNKETYEAMLKHFGSGVITEKHKTHPAWYRWKLKKQGLLA